MTDRIEIQPVGPLDATVRPPGSKSLTNRALVCAALARGESMLTGALDSDDTRVMVESLNRLGIVVRAGEAPHTLQVTGCGGVLPRERAELYIENSGTTVRFLTALVALGQGTYRLAGVERMHQRPIADLLDALNALGADARSEAGTGCPPVVVRAKGLAGGVAEIGGEISSQYLSGLLMAAPCAHADVRLNVVGQLVSQPYVRMTAAVMESFGATVNLADWQSMVVPAPQSYEGRSYAIEPDASAASYFWGAAAIAGGSVKVTGLTREALQGDVAFVDCLAQMGCRLEEDPDGIRVSGGPLRGIEVDMNAISDTVQTLAAVALFADGPTTITGVAHNRFKETDRIADLACELRKLGAIVEELADGLRISPGKLRPAEIETYQDHRMAMSLSLVGLRQPGVVIRNPGCTSKTYPHFFEDLAAIGAT